MVAIREEGGRTLLPVHDGLGNITAVINAINGDMVARYDYAPFGELLAENGDVNACPFRYQSKYYDAETGLSYFGYRYYSAKLGRWISRDPLGEDGGFNLYGYCGNDPVNRWDYLGLVDLTPDQMEMYRNIFIKNAVEATPEQLKKMYESAQSRLLSYNYLHIKHAIGLQNTDAVKEYLSRNYPGVDYSNLQTDMLMQDAFSMVYGARIKSDNRALLAASAVGSVVPGVGETMDGYVLFAPSSSIGERFVAGASLTLNAATIGFAPNFGAPARIARRGMHVADEVVELGLDAEKNLLHFQQAAANKTALNDIDFGKHLRGIKGDAPAEMFDPHAHHIVFKEGLGEAQKALVQEGHALLRRYEIDPILGAENLIWAPMRVKGQHGIDALRNAIEQLKAVEAAGGSRADIVEMLEELGRVAAQRR